MKLVYVVRSVLASALFILNTVIFGSMAVIGSLFTSNVKFGNWILSTWSGITAWSFNIKTHVRGEENLNEHGHIIVFNHSSHFDIVVILAGIKKTLRFGAKIELYSIPIFGRAMRAVGTLPITRGDREKVLNLYNESISKVKNGMSFCLAAEGTRQPKPGVGEKFKAGPFIFAISGHLPVLPIVLCGVSEILPKGRLLACTDKWRHDAYIDVLRPISTDGLNEDDRRRLQDETREKMVNSYQVLEQSLNRA